jgi:hypothetical protein
MYCARHPKVETVLCCGRCMTPICPKCSVAGAVGMLCPNCASNRTAHIYQVRPERFALAALLGLVAGTIVGLALQMISGIFIFFMFFVASAIGGFLGELILRVTGRKRGPKIEFLAGLSVIGGAIISLAIKYGVFGLISLRFLMVHSLSLIWFLVAVGLTAAAAIGKIKYF